MKSNLNVTIVQSDLVWEDPVRNLAQFSEKLSLITEPTDLIVLPEMFTTGFSVEAVQLAEKMDGIAMKWLSGNASHLNCVITGSFICKENDKVFNRMVWMRPDGTYEYYDKRHLFRLANEQDYFSSGDRRVIVDLHGWKICLLICYDLRFPVWSRNRNDYDAAIYVANWPEKRRDPWVTLLHARAIENQVYIIGVNRVGVDGKNQRFSGDSAVIDPKGISLSKTMPYVETIETVELDWQELSEFRKAYPVMLDADDFELKI